MPSLEGTILTTPEGSFERDMDYIPDRTMFLAVMFARKLMRDVAAYLESQPRQHRAISQ